MPEQQMVFIRDILSNRWNIKNSICSCILLGGPLSGEGGVGDEVTGTHQMYIYIKSSIPYSYKNTVVMVKPTAERANSFGDAIFWEIVENE